MTASPIHEMTTAWTSSDPAVVVSVDPETYVGESPGSNRIVSAGAPGATVTYVAGAPLDLSGFDELRFWIRGDRAADGSPQAPFFLELSYADAGDLPGETHAWFVPVNRAEAWEQRRIGIEHDRRTAVSSLRFRALTAGGFACNVDELLAVREEMLPDLERALALALAPSPPLPGLTDLPPSVAAVAGAHAVVLPLNRALAAGNRVLVTGGSAGPETHDVVSVTHDSVAATSTLEFDPADVLAGNLAVATARVSVIAPVVFEAPPAPTAAVDPALLVTPLGAREDLDRTTYYQQRDSFRLRGTRTVCSVRPAPRAYLAEYEVTAVARDRMQQALLYDHVVGRLSIDRALRVNGAAAPVEVLKPPDIRRRDPGQAGPVYVRLGTRLETAPRREQTWVQHVHVGAGRVDAPPAEATEAIVLEL